MCDHCPLVQIWCMVLPDDAKAKLGDVQLWVSFTFSWVYMLAQVRLRLWHQHGCASMSAPLSMQTVMCGLA